MDIRDLERKYMNLIWNWVSSSAFERDLLEIESYIKKNHSDLEIKYQIKNKIQLAAERLLSFYVHKKMNVIDIYSSPISSDLAFYTDDCLINIDSKTIDLDGNKNDDKYIQFGPHQISFLNKPLFDKTISGKKFEGVTLNPGLPEIDPARKVPCLTFFIGITYHDDRSDFMISSIKLSSVPNGIIAREDYNNDLIKNFKTYRYLKEKAAQLKGPEYMPRKQKDGIPKHWTHFALKGSGKVDSWLDTKLKHPFNSKATVFWKILANKYHICLNGDTARILPARIMNRKDSSGRIWKGVRTKKVRS